MKESLIAANRLSYAVSMKYLIATLLALLSYQNSFAGADLILNDDTHELVMKAHLIYYGDIDRDRIDLATREIEGMWSGKDAHGSNSDTPLKATVNGNEYKLTAVITYEVVSTADAIDMARSNSSAANNFIFVQKGSPYDRSFYTGLGANTGAFYLSDDIGRSTTAAHEFGHGLGLAHPNLFDWRGKGQPAVMCPRGTLVDPQYQWDTHAHAGEDGGTLSPYSRKVIQYDVNELHIDNLVFMNGKATLGDATNRLVTAGSEKAFPGRVH